MMIVSWQVLSRSRGSSGKMISDSKIALTLTVLDACVFRWITPAPWTSVLHHTLLQRIGAGILKHDEHLDDDVNVNSIKRLHDGGRGMDIRCFCTFFVTVP